MKNLQNFDVHELNTKEMINIDGGGNTPKRSWWAAFAEYILSGDAKKDFITSANAAAAGHSYGTGRGYF
ncbi:hypothetical protein JL193_03770 [Polaribacter batillariae]|uniref:Uncharacterized protein n=1 Tax=Polaribacter batillariae TaxID=2808900 RepID=A0ABX7SW05_9FLAO|nr:hypothetical protein [Polaribacter batillariae]QTD38425.1 hypothetical protein JL193_03770 [Polaribacter batillariae]